MQAIFFTFTKRINSTKIPNDSSGVVKSVVLKENTSINNPTLKITSPNLNYNYVKFVGNYYFIQDIVLGNNNVYEVHCTIDVLATFRSDILSYTAFVERSASSYDTLVNDHLLSRTQDIVNKSVVSTATGFTSPGMYQILVASKQGVKPYVFDSLSGASAFYNAHSFTSDSGSGGVIQSIVKGVDDFLTSGSLQAIGLSQYCSPIMWLPTVAKTDAGGVAAGWWDLDLSGYYVNANPFHVITGALAMPSNAYSDFRKGSPEYSRYTAYFPGVGTVSLSAIDCAEDDLYVDIWLDCLSGAITYRVYHSSGADVATFNAQMGVQIPCGATSFQTGNLILNTLGNIAMGAATGNPVGVASGIASSAMNIANTILEPQTTINGGSGNQTAIQERMAIYVSCENYGSKQFPISECGRPLYQNVTLSGLSGFCKCGNASVPTAADEAMKTMINDTLNSGFYIE